MNKVILIGRLVKEPELRYTSSNIAVVQFPLAIPRPASEESDFINIIVWRKQAENCSKYLHKGSKVAIEGSIQTRNYEKDGQKKYITEIVANSVQFLDTPKTKKGESNPFEEMGDIVQAESDLPF